MDQLPLTLLDIAVLAVIVLSALLAMARGLVRETLTIASWVGAVAVAYYAFAPVREIVAQAVDNQWLGDGLTLAAAFLVPLVAFKIISAMIARSLTSEGLTFVDRIGGVVFGAARGAVLVVVLYFLASFLIRPSEQPDWVQQARVLPYVEQGVELLRGFLPAEFEDQGRERTEEALERIEDVGDLARSVTPLLAPEAGGAPAATDPSE